MIGCSNQQDRTAGASPYLRMFEVLMGGLLTKQAKAAAERLRDDAGDRLLLQAKIATADFFVQQIMPMGVALLSLISAGAAKLNTMTKAQFER